jgi:hypothetical protein
VAHDCNPSYSGGRDQEDRGSEPAWANTLWDLSQKYLTHKKRAGGVGQGVGRFKPQYHKNKSINKTRKKDFECFYHKEVIIVWGGSMSTLIWILHDVYT